MFHVEYHRYDIIYTENIFSKFKLLRWYVGGKWAYLDGHWLNAGKGEYLFDSVGRHYGCHYEYNGVSKREDYSK